MLPTLYQYWEVDLSSVAVTGNGFFTGIPLLGHHNVGTVSFAIEGCPECLPVKPVPVISRTWRARPT